MNMIEKVARALWVDRYTADWSTAGEKLQAQYCKHAKDCIEAMREPSDGMIVRGDIKAEYVRRVWQEMIDTALKEE